MKLWIHRRHWLILPQTETELLPKNHDQASEAEWAIQRGSCYNLVRSHCCFLRMRHCKVQNEIWAWVFRILTVHSTNIIWSFFFFFFTPWFPGGSEVKVSASNAGDLGSIPGSGRFPWGRKWQSTPVFLPGESHGWRSLVGYSPRGRKELDMTEQLHLNLKKCEKC